MDELKKQNPQNYKLDVQSYSTYEEVYNSITKEGSLGLLALGAVGLKLWRRKREELEKQNKGNGE